ncbi:MAG: ParB/RepB/Spo0J family partition protein [Elusimicrobia bacterium]|nr:ParB/RepB/Spo0J family partition protein [Elusimicrobiota bacterium]
MRQALGKGLEALIPKAIPKNAIQKIPIAQIRPNPYQPRRSFDPEGLKELAQSIRKHGLAQPIVVTFHAPSQSYELVAGERRLRACEIAGLSEIEALVRQELPNAERLALSLVENLQREDLNPIEAAQGYQRLLQEFSLTQSELSEVIGKSRPTIANTLRLLDLPEEILGALRSGSISEGHARALLGVSQAVERRRLLEKVLREKLTVRELEVLVQEWKQSSRKGSLRGPSKNGKKPETKLLERELEQILGTRIEISAQRNHRGRISLYFFSLEDFDRLISLLKKNRR